MHGTSKSIRLVETCVRYRRSTAGDVAPMFALAVIPVFGLMGMAVDYSHGAAMRAAMQAAVDATSLNLAKKASALTQEQLSQQVTDGFSATFSKPEMQSVAVSALYTAQDKSLTVAATGLMKTNFLSIIGFSSLTIGARAVAKPVGDGTACVLALNSTAAGAITVQGNTTVNLSGCSLYSDSNSSSALTVGGTASLTALSVGVVGGISGNQSISTTKGVSTGLSPIPDPYAGVALPAVTGCDHHNFSAKDKMTISAGVYCGGMKFGAGADVTLNPGIYIIDQDDLAVNGGAKLTGTGVTIVFTSSTSTKWPTATINGGATVNLTPPTTGPTAGIVLYGDRNAPVGTAFTLDGGASQYFGGAVYLPKGAVKFSGGSSTGAGCTQVIGDTVTFTGNSGLAINCQGAATKPFGPTGVRLVS